MTLNDIELMSYRRLGYGDTPATDVVTRMRQWINTWHQRLLARPGLEQLRDYVGAIQFSTAVSIPQYDLPATVRRVQKIYELETPTALRMVTTNWIRETDPGHVATGIPVAWAPRGWNVLTPPLAQLSVRLWPTPSSIINYFVDAQTTVVDLTASTDIPLLPYEYHWLLVEAACYEEWLRKADTRAGTARQDLETGFKEMRHWVNNPYDYKPTNAQTRQGSSRLGGMYPAW